MSTLVKPIGVGVGVGIGVGVGVGTGVGVGVGIGVGVGDATGFTVNESRLGPLLPVEVRRILLVPACSGICPSFVFQFVQAPLVGNVNASSATMPLTESSIGREVF